jgi:CDP-glucose 4,6-dehydratase
MLNLKFFKGKKIFITGHTGFKGSWLTLILHLGGARIVGYSHKPKNKSDNFYLLKLDKKIKNYYCDVRDEKKLKNAITKFKPDMIFHLAAQSLVRESYLNPKFTFLTNAIGTLNILEVCRQSKSIKSIVIVTSDKCYKNYERKRAYNEEDEIGGEDPYSSSKAVSENIFYSYLKSYFKSKKNVGLVSVRSGNVIGGGDWSKDRIIPDLIKSIILKKNFMIRNPNSSRPWLHVFDSINGYLILSKKIYNNNKLNGSWNFGPNKNNIIVKNIISKILKILKIKKKILFKKNTKVKETVSLNLNSKKSRKFLNWRPKLSLLQSLKLTAEWYIGYIKNSVNIEKMSTKQVKSFFKL